MHPSQGAPGKDWLPSSEPSVECGHPPGRNVARSGIWHLTWPGSRALQSQPVIIADIGMMRWSLLRNPFFAQQSVLVDFERFRERHQTMVS